MTEVTHDRAQTDAWSRNEVFEALAHPRRRTLLRILDRVARARPADLATHLVAEETGQPLMDVEREQAQQALLDVEHVHLPRLVDANLASLEDGVVTATNHPALQDPKIDELIDTDARDWDAVLDSLADGHRRVALTALHRNGEMDRTDLAVEVAANVRDVERDPDTNVEGVLRDLQHVHLPKLEAAGLVATDGEAVTYEGHPALDEEWLVAGPEDTPRAILSMADRSADIWTLSGRDDVTERGRALFDRADEELFLMFTTAGLLDEGCIRGLQNAVDRGVDVYLGSQTPEVRDLVRERVPGVVIWEPQMDWLNLPPRREKLGRLVFTDREDVMIGTFGELEEGRRETAVTGSGENNPLVMLLRELLGARLDHLDAQSADFRSQIPL